MSHHLLEARELRYAFPDGTPALDGVSFRITHGESVAVVGANGAGKSTLLLHLCGALLPSSGSLRVGDVPLAPTTLETIRRTVGIVFQDGDDQLFMPTVAEDVAFGPRNLGLPPEEVAARVARALARVGIPDLGPRPPHRLSGGEKRRAAIATVLALSPDILVLDEPSAGLDPRARRLLIGLLKEFRHTKVVATHDLDLVLDTCERTIVLSHGKVRADGPTHAIFEDEPLLLDCGLERPLSMGNSPSAR